MGLTRAFVTDGVVEGRGSAIRPSLIPIAIGCTMAQYFSFALFQGQQGDLLANDPLFRPAQGMRGQYPLILVMIGYTCGGINLLAGG